VPPPTIPHVALGAQIDLPELVAGELAALRDRLDREIPAKALERNLLLATWNIRHFGDLSETFDAGPEDRPKRDLRALTYLTEIVARFDVVAVQEVRSNLKALRWMLKALGPDWTFLLTDVTAGDAGNDERLAFVFDLRRVRPSGLAAEIVLPPERGGVAREQFARTPYAVSFVASGRHRRHTFVLTTVHIRYGSSQLDRLDELADFAAWMASWAEDMNRFHHDLIVLGDFNIDRAGDPAYQAFVSGGLTVPAQLASKPRTIFDRGDGEHFYDQIAWFSQGAARLQMPPTERGGTFDFVGTVYPELAKRDVSWRISDHLPLWLEFDLTAPVPDDT